MIKLKNIQCKFDKRVILESISLEIPSHLTILGANGSGKSTLAKAISSLTPFDGTISIDETDIHNLSLKEKAKLLSYIPAKLEIYDSFISVEEFVLLGRFAYKKSFLDYSYKDKTIAKESIKLLKLEHLNDSAISSLSSGEQQLVLIAQALAQQSKTIIFDEPTANLDPHNAKIIAQRIKALQEYHQVILITHDIHLASYVDTPVIFIKDTKTHYYENDFFDDATLKELYGVSFNAMVAQYD